jgi:serine/threonine-protein kinase
MVTTADVPPPTEIRPGIPKDLDRIIKRALARDPEERYATALELSRDLAFVQGQVSSPVPTNDVSALMKRHFGSRQQKKSDFAAHFLRI